MNLYRSILGVSETASDEEIKTAYRKLCKAYHPDLRGADPFGKDEAARLGDGIARMAAINEAYAALIKTGPKDGGEKVEAVEKSASELTRYKDSAYAYYRRARLLFLQVRNASAMEAFELYRSGGSATLDAFERNVLESMYYFNIVCQEYSDSSWCEDSVEKLRLLERDRQFVRNMRNGRG